MSGIVKGIKKVFKKVGKIVKKIWKPLLIAAAVYFTGGLALSAFGPTQAFAASLPGFGISASGAATGIFSQAASSLGLAGGLQAGAAAAAGGAAGAVGTGIAIAGAEGGAGAVLSGVAGGATAGGGAASLGAGITAAGTAAGGAAAAVGMSLTDKLMIASMGTKALGAALGPTIDEEVEARKKWRGAYYGMDAAGNTAEEFGALPSEQGAPAQPAESTEAPAAAGTQQIPEQQPRELMGQADPAPTPTTPGRELMSEKPAAGPARPAPVTNAPVQPQTPNMPGVRYV